MPYPVNVFFAAIGTIGMMGLTVHVLQKPQKWWHKYAIPFGLAAAGGAAILVDNTAMLFHQDHLYLHYAGQGGLVLIGAAFAIVMYWSPRKQSK